MTDADEIERAPLRERAAAYQAVYEELALELERAPEDDPERGKA